MTFTQTRMFSFVVTLNVNQLMTSLDGYCVANTDMETAVKSLCSRFVNGYFLWLVGAVMLGICAVTQV